MKTFDYMLHNTIYSDKTAKAAENYLRFAVDVEQRLLYTDRIIGRTPDFKLTYKDGRATAYDLRGGETFTPPQNLVAPFKRWFDQVVYPKHPRPRPAASTLQRLEALQRGRPLPG